MSGAAKARYSVIKGGGEGDGRGDRRVIDDQGELDLDSVAIPSDHALLLEQNLEARRKIAALRRELQKMYAAEPQAETIMRVLEYWRSKTNHPKAQLPLDGSRAKAVRKMLALYSEEQLCAVIDAVAAHPYMGAWGERFCCPEEGRKRRDDIELIFRDERHVEELLALAADADHDAYRRWLHGVLREHPRLVPALAALAVKQPHGDVLAAAAVWARGQLQARIGDA